jgi:hypothetical protein
MADSTALSVGAAHITSNPLVRGWYSCESAKSQSENILREAYENATSIFQAELSEDKNEKGIIGGNFTLEDVLQTLTLAKARYEAKHTSKARKWLGIFSSKVMFYASILDVLEQHHPEYVSLVWGAMRLLFLVCHPSAL